MQAGVWNYVGVVVGYAMIFFSWARRPYKDFGILALMGAVIVGLATISRPSYKPEWLQLLFLPAVFMTLGLLAARRRHENSRSVKN